MQDLNYKFYNLKTYCSSEWLYDSKKYRQVFDVNELRYIYTELSFYNKRFDEHTWEARINLKAFRLDMSRKELCNLLINRTVATSDNIVYIREGWGQDQIGDYWKPGEYCWEAYIDDALVGTSYFYVYDVGVVTPDSNKYFKIDSCHLYEAPDQNLLRSARKYLVEFDYRNTRYVWVECTIDSLVDHEFMCELHFNYYNDAHQLKGRSVKMAKVYPGDKTVIEAGWGSDSKATWFEDNFSLEIVFMDTLIAVIPFRMSKEHVEGHNELMTINDLDFFELSNAYAMTAETNKKNLDELLEELNDLIGLKTVKKEVKDYIQYLNFIKIRKERGIEDNSKISIHSAFLGNPGTGKTTVARLLGKIYHAMGLLSKGHVHEVDRADLVAEYIGQTAPKVKEQIELARGGILFIDEAYALYRSGEDSKDFGREVIEIVLKEMSDGKGDIAIFVAGYPKEMDVFLESNPGLKSRFAKIYNFEDYTPQELHAISQLEFQQNKLQITDEAMNYFAKKLTDLYRKRSESFGNARLVISLVNDSKMNMGLRLMKMDNIHELPNEAFSLITLEDIQETFSESAREKPIIQIDEDLLAESLAELNNLKGLNNVKKEVNELIKLVKFYQEEGKDVLNKFSLHSVFTGNPGTGKTTVARIVAKIFKALGILERGEIVEVDREALVGAFVGQTAIKTNAMIDKAKGGILFIDEAYALAAGSRGDYGYEAIDTLLKRMEDLRGELIVIVAGYTDRMRDFLESNPGLRSRFDRKFDFEDYQSNELFEIYENMLAQEDLSLDKDAKAFMEDFFVKLERGKSKFFGNARAVRKIVEQTIKNQHLRLAELKVEKRTPKVKRSIVLNDVKDFDANKDSMLESGKGVKIGF
ncbi:MAG: AAA family ATPase [Chitinophagales bacterium]|jgi:SpoVK/Ycf46/Vps4 family AAA+-type ATPase|nr:AAA family ATPase [Chitinophagales bacterium]